MEMLHSLGINATLFVQLVIFLVTFFVLDKVVFAPYVKAHRERSDRTTGGEDLAREIYLESKDLEFHYEKRARQINDQVKSHFDQARAAAYKEHNDILDTARGEALEIVEKTRKQVAASAEAARKDLEKELPALSGEITNKLIGREAHA